MQPHCCQNQRDNSCHLSPAYKSVTHRRATRSHCCWWWLWFLHLLRLLLSLMDSGNEFNSSDSQEIKKRSHRHTPHQIEELESMFKECPHPNDRQRMKLSKDLGLDPRQIMFWFQNRRTQMKAQHERDDNYTVRMENDRIRCENITMKEAMKKAICPTCGVSPPVEDPYFDVKKMRMENARLKDELDRVSSIASRYLGRPMTHLPPIQTVPVSMLDFSAVGTSSKELSPSQNPDLVHASPSAVASYPYSTITPELQKPIMVEIAKKALEELTRLAHTNEPLWIKYGADEREVLHVETYYKIFPRPAQQLRSPNSNNEASRDSGVVFMSTDVLIESFMDANKWAELFPSIISKAAIIEVLATGMAGNRSGTLLLMYEELHVLSPIAPKREFCFLRYCQQIEPGLWVLADVSVSLLKGSQDSTPSSSWKLPSGCLIEDMSNGYSKVTWVEHVETEEWTPTHQLYRDLINSGVAFGAQRWMATLHRMCERFACLMLCGTTPMELGGVIPSPKAKRSMMKLSLRLMNNFCASIAASNGHPWNKFMGLDDVAVVSTIHESTDIGHPTGVVISVATSMLLPVSCQRVFNLFRDENTRAQWDVLCQGNAVQELAHISNGSHPGNRISLLQGVASSEQNNILILQESCIDSSGSLVVYAPIVRHYINIAMSGEDSSFIPLLPSGFTIIPYGQTVGGSGTSTSSNPMGGSDGSLLTVLFQMLISSDPSDKLSFGSVETVKNIISDVVRNIKAILKCNAV